MKKMIAVMLSILMPVLVFAGDNSYKVAYDGGSIPVIKADRCETVHRVRSNPACERQG